MSVIFHRTFEDFSSKFRNFCNFNPNFFVFLTDFDEIFSEKLRISPNLMKFSEILKIIS